jgi:hypothetical protein
VSAGVEEYPVSFSARSAAGRTGARPASARHNRVPDLSQTARLRWSLEESDDGIWSRYLGSVLLGKIDEATMRVSG